MRPFSPGSGVASAGAASARTASAESTAAAGAVLLARHVLLKPAFSELFQLLLDGAELGRGRLGGLVRLRLLRNEVRKALSTGRARGRSCRLNASSAIAQAFPAIANRALSKLSKFGRASAYIPNHRRGS